LDFAWPIPKLTYPQTMCILRFPRDLSLKETGIPTAFMFCKNNYGGKDASWNQHLVKGLKELRFEQSKLDECVFFQGTMIFMVYMDDGILIDPDNSWIDKAMLDLQSKFEVQDKGDLSDYLGVKIRKHPDGSIEFTQPQLINSILEGLKLVDHGGENSAKALDTPCKHDGKMNKVFKICWYTKCVYGINTLCLHYCNGEHYSNRVHVHYGNGSCVRSTFPD
jgi:Reverse transcriptase (RNA-dependent DNA polymerase)